MPRLPLILLFALACTPDEKANDTNGAVAPTSGTTSTTPTGSTTTSGGWVVELTNGAAVGCGASVNSPAWLSAAGGGDVVVAFGESTPAGDGMQIVVERYGSTGTRVWRTEWASPGGCAGPLDVAVTPDGQAIVVLGNHLSVNTGEAERDLLFVSSIGSPYAQTTQLDSYSTRKLGIAEDGMVLIPGRMGSLQDGFLATTEAFDLSGAFVASWPDGPDEPQLTVQGVADPIPGEPALVTWSSHTGACDGYHQELVARAADGQRTVLWSSDRPLTESLAVLDDGSSILLGGLQAPGGGSPGFPCDVDPALMSVDSTGAISWSHGPDGGEAELAALPTGATAVDADRVLVANTRDQLTRPVLEVLDRTTGALLDTQDLTVPAAEAWSREVVMAEPGLAVAVVWDRQAHRGWLIGTPL